MRDLKLYDHRMISWYYSIPTVPSHLMCSCSQHTVFWLSFFPQRLEFSLKGRKSLIILLVEDATHFWFFFSAQYSRLRQALQPIKFQICLKRFKGKDTLLCVSFCPFFVILVKVITFCGKRTKWRMFFLLWNVKTAQIWPEQYVRVKQYELCALYTRNVQNTAAPTFNTVLSTGL